MTSAAYPAQEPGPLPGFPASPTGHGGAAMSGYTGAPPPGEGRLMAPRLPPLPPNSPSTAAMAAPLPFGDPSRAEPGSMSPLGTQPITSLRGGYVNGPALGHSDPGLEPQRMESALSLRPSNHHLYIGLAVVLVGIIVLLVILILEGPSEGSGAMSSAKDAEAALLAGDGAHAGPAYGAVAVLPGGAKLRTAGARPADAAPPASGADASGHAPSAEPGAGGLAPGAVEARTAAGDAARPSARAADPALRAAAAPARLPGATIRLRVESTPSGAEVSLAGKLLGTTPIHTETARRSGTEVLAIHRVHYHDVVTRIDLGRDYDQAITLAPLPEPAAGDRRERETKPAARDRAGSREPRARAAAKEDCQPPDRLNPFETCHGHACKPCPTTTP